MNPIRIPRQAQTLVQQLLAGFPIVTITGPRQSGKTTLAKAIFADRPYYSLEDPDVRAWAQEDPRDFLAQLADGGVIDEIQRVPDLLSYLQTLCDNDGRMGRFLLTGSQQFGLIAGISQSLAGRSAFVELPPFSWPELSKVSRLPESLESACLSGGYPPLYDRPLTPQQWLPAYVTAYVERDVRQITQVQDLDSFQRFVRLCAGRSGQILNYAALGTDCGITAQTARAWIGILEASYLVFLLRSHHRNFNKRLIKAPKLYFYDSGLLCWLLGITEERHLITHPLRGAIAESAIVAELRKGAVNRGLPPALWYWRDSNGLEVDVIIEQGGQIRPIEIKSGHTLASDATTALNRWTALAGNQTLPPTLIYGGSQTMQRKGVSVLPWQHSDQIWAAQEQ